MKVGPTNNVIFDVATPSRGLRGFLRTLLGIYLHFDPERWLLWRLVAIL